MEYSINPNAFLATFQVPCKVVDQQLKLASEAQLRVLLYTLRNMGDAPAPDAIAKALRMAEADVRDTLLFWAQAGVLQTPESDAPQAQAERPAPARRAARAPAIKPTREEVARRGEESEEIVFLLREAQMKFGRGLRQNEASTLVWLHDDEGMSTALILMLLEFARSRERLNIGYIERTAIDWINEGITDLAGAEARIVLLEEQQSAWGLVRKTMGLDRRSPSAKELALCHRWVNEWGFGRELLRAAYEQCVNATGKFSMAYIGKVLDGWHKQNVKSAADLETLQRPASGKRQSGYAAYDLDMVEKLLVNGEGS